MKDRFLEKLAEFEALHEYAKRVSSSSGGYVVDQKTGWAQWIHLRICILAQTMRDIADVARRMSHRLDCTLDCIGSAAVSRSMMEAGLMFNYVFEPVSSEEWEIRFLGLCIHDAIFRRRAFKIYNKYDQILYRQEGESINKMKAEIRSALFFQRLPEECRMNVLAGVTPFIYSRKKLVVRFGWDSEVYESVFAYFSNYAHASTGAFIRTNLHGVDFRVPTEMQFAFVGYAMGICAKTVQEASEKVHECLKGAGIELNEAL